jgi:hypothetical protein
VGPIAYYGFLATRVAPQRLLAAAARRAVRTAWNRVAPPLPPPPDELLDLLRCDDGAALARLLARGRSARPPWTRDALRAALERHLPGETERAIARAEDAARGRLRLFGREVDVARTGGGTDWQLDPHHGGRFAGWAPSWELPRPPGLDLKMTWALGRGDQWIALACGAALDERRGDELTDALSSSVKDFVASNPVGFGAHWTCAMEAGLRAWNLVLALWILALRGRALDVDLAADAARLLVSTGRFVLAHLEDDTAVPNNHLAADWLGLLACAEGLPEWPEAARWRALALDGLRRAVAEQVHADGTSFEGSVPYQRLATEIFASAALLALAARSPLGHLYVRRLVGLFRATRGLLAESGELPQIGDNDSGRALALRERGPTEGGYLLPLGAALLRDPALLVERGTAGAVEVAWLLGPGALAWLEQARPAPRPGSASFPRGGFHALRRGGLELFVSCGANGQRGVGGHSHNDKLAVELFARGRRVVCDPGSPTYTGDPELRNLFRATAAHATVTVDGLEQAPIPADRLFALPEAALARVLSFEPGGEAERLAGEHHGFARAGIVHRREIAVVDGGALVVDRLGGPGTHAVVLRWPFASPAARLRTLSPGEAERAHVLARALGLRARLDLARAIEVPLDGAGQVLVVFAVPRGLAPEVVPSSFSPGYGELEDGSAAVVAGPVPCPASLATLFLLID